MSTTLVVLVLWWVVIEDPRRLSRRSLRGDELLSQVVDLVEERYIRELDDMEVAYDAIRGVVEGLDPYSQFYDPRERVEFEEETEGRFGGIGVLVRQEGTDLVVSYPMLGAPAERAGVRACDKIVAIDGDIVPAIRTREVQDEVISTLKGVPGTTVSLTVEGLDGEHRTVEIQRESIPRRSVLGAEVLDPEAGIGYLVIRGFQESTVEEFDAAVRELLRPPAIRSLIVDLRCNPGGVLTEAIDLADRFLASGTITLTRGRSERSSRDYAATPENDLPDELALVVLVNGDSASASEVFAGAIQDHRRGVLVGEPSYGKGVVQNVLYLNRQDVVLKVTSAAYFTPAGRCIEKRVPVPGIPPDEGGILPDVLVRDLVRSRGELEAHLYRARAGEDYALDVEPCPVPRPSDMAGPGEESPSDEDEAEAGFVDPQLDAALDLLKGVPVHERLASGAKAGESG